jgi:hypothetical protein
MIPAFFVVDRSRLQDRYPDVRGHGQNSAAPIPWLVAGKDTAVPAT